MRYVDIIIESLIREEANKDQVIDAIKKRYEVEINYKGEGLRAIQPCAYGKSPKGNLVVRAYQTMGFSETSNAGWKEFNLSDIEEWKPNKTKKFKMPSGFNPNGDMGMSEVYIIANFNGQKNDALIRYNDRRAAEKREKNPYYDLERNIKRSTDGNKYDHIRKNLADWQKSTAAQEFNKPQGSSVYDMAQINDFGDNNSTQTVGPVMKNNIEGRNERNTEPLNYDNVAKNGPVYKRDMIQQEVDSDKYETENNRDDENLSNNNNEQ